jgi:hypothetical protein
MNVHPNIEMVFVPPYTITLLHPLDQEVIKCFRSYYSLHTWADIAGAIENYLSMTMTWMTSEGSLMVDAEVCKLVALTHKHSAISVPKSKK